jgi:hypothetical protein
MPLRAGGDLRAQRAGVRSSRAIIRITAPQGVRYPLLMWITPPIGCQRQPDRLLGFWKPRAATLRRRGAEFADVRASRRRSHPTRLRRSSEDSCSVRSFPLKLATAAADEAVMSGAGICLVGFVVGAISIALWCHVRLRRLRPKTIAGAILHLGCSLAILSLTPASVSMAAASVRPSPALALAVTLLVVAPLSYVILGCIWFLARLLDWGSSRPGGGHGIRLPLN